MLPSMSCSGVGVPWSAFAASACRCGDNSVSFGLSVLVSLAVAVLVGTFISFAMILGSQTRSRHPVNGVEAELLQFLFLNTTSRRITRCHALHNFLDCRLGRRSEERRVG